MVWPRFDAASSRANRIHAAARSGRSLCLLARISTQACAPCRAAAAVMGRGGAAGRSAPQGHCVFGGQLVELGLYGVSEL